MQMFCDGAEAQHYRDQHVFIVGGANSAGQGAIFFSGYASKVTMLVRSSLSKSMSHYLIDQTNSTSNIEILSKTEVIEAHGKDRLQSITIKNSETGKTDTIKTPAMFLFIGAAPHTDLVRGVIELSEADFILTGPDLIQNEKRPKNWRLKRDPYLMETSVPGIFAAGDVRHGVVRRVASAVGQGSIAVSFVHQYLKTV